MSMNTILLLALTWSSFVNPPVSAKPWTYWLWENSCVDGETIREELADIDRLGFGGVLLSDSRGYWDDDDHVVKPSPKMRWGSDEWLDTVADAIRVASEHKLVFSLNIAASGGHLRGDVDVGDDSPKFLVCRCYLPGDVFEKPDLPNFRDVAVFAVRTAEPAVRSEWANAGDGYLSMEGNRGKAEAVTAFSERTALEVRELADVADEGPLGSGWTILRFGRATLRGRETDVDILDTAAVRRHLDRVVGALLTRIPGLYGQGRTFVNLYNVSWEGVMPTWSATFEEDFARSEGYEVRPFLPILAGFNLADKPRDDFQRDFRHARGMMMIRHLYGAVRTWAHERGMCAFSESGGPWTGDLPRDPKTFGEADQLAYLAANDFPQGEFWPLMGKFMSPKAGHANVNAGIFARGVAAAAHIYDMPIVSAEAFTHMHHHWSVDPAFLKPVGDQAFADGVNRFVWHTYTSSPKSYGIPGMEYFAGSHINRNVTWNRELGAFVTYLARCQSLLQRGRPVTDIAVLCGDRSYHGWGKPANGRLRNRVSHEMDVFVPDGYACDPVNDDALKRNPDLLKRYAIVFDARKPENRKAVVPTGSLLPDVELFGENTSFSWCHRREGRSDWYFVVGEGVYDVAFRAAAKSVEIWDAVQGVRWRANAKLLADGRTRVRMELPIGGSCFVVFTEPDGGALAQPPVRGSVCSKTGPWQVGFRYHPGIASQPPAAVTMKELVDWTTRDDLRHFAGTATYRTQLTVHQLPTINQPTKYELELGRVPSGLAHVRLNGIDLGTVWCEPWSVDVTKAVRIGENQLEVEYTNNWYNRLVGDCVLPKEERVTRSLVRYWDKPRTGKGSFWNLRPTIYSGPSVSDELQPSGLLGPIVVRGK